MTQEKTVDIADQKCFNKNAVDMIEHYNYKRQRQMKTVDEQADQNLQTKKTVQ